MPQRCAAARTRELAMTPERSPAPRPLPFAYPARRPWRPVALVTGAVGVAALVGVVRPDARVPRGTSLVALSAPRGAVDPAEGAASLLEGEFPMSEWLGIPRNRLIGIGGSAAGGLPEDCCCECECVDNDCGA